MFGTLSPLQQKLADDAAAKKAEAARIAARKGRKTGRKARSFDAAVPHWSSLRLGVRGVVPPPVPPVLNWRKSMPADLGMMLNGPTPGNPNAPILGDCTNAGAHHLRQAWTFNAGGKMITDPDSAILQGYEESCGYVSGDPNTDQGGNLQDVLKYWMTKGMPAAGGNRSKIIGFIEIDPRNPHDIRRAIAECGGVYTGGVLPDSYMQVNPGGTWGIAEAGSDGHCTIALGYDESNIFMDTWGFVVPTADGAVVDYWDEIYAVVSEDWIKKTGTTPFGMSMADVWATMGPLQQSAVAGAKP